MSWKNQLNVLVFDIFLLMRFYAVQIGIQIRTFRDKVSVTDYQSTLRKSKKSEDPIYMAAEA